MHNVKVFCDVPHDIEEGRCALCERDAAIGELVAFQEAVLSVHGTLWNSVYAKAQEISQQNPLYGMSVKKRSEAYPRLVKALRNVRGYSNEAAELLRELGEAE